MATTFTEAAIEYCSPRGAPPDCRYTAQVTSTETRDATRYCSPAGTLPFCRYTDTETRRATLVFVGTMPVGYVCPSGWTLSGSECSRRVTRYGTAKYRCSTGWRRTGSTCWRTVTVDVAATGTVKYRCKASWTRSGSTCSRTVTRTVTRYGTLRYRCRPGPWNLSGTTCSRTVTVTVNRTGTVAYRCPAGWTPSGITCERSVPHTRYDEPTLTPTCATGTPTGGRCLTHELPRKICDTANNWRLVGGSCVRTLTQPPLCPAGFPDLRDGACHPPAPTTTTAAPPPTTAPPTTPTTSVAPLRPPGAPRFVELLAGDEQLTATWQRPLFDGRTPIIAYLVEYRAVPSERRVRLPTGGNSRSTKPGGAVVWSRTITGLTNGATYQVRIAAANRVSLKWSDYHEVTLPESPVRIDGLDRAERAGAGALSDDFTVTPADAACTALITNPRPSNPQAPDAPTVTLTSSTGGSRTVTVDAEAPGAITVQITCTHSGHSAATESVTFTAADPCTVALTPTAKATIRQGEWSMSDQCTSKHRNPGNTQTPYYAWRYTFTLPAAATVAIDLKSSEDTYLYLWGTRDDGTEFEEKKNDDVDATNSDSRLSLDLQPGTYTIEATTAGPSDTGKFKLIVAPITTHTAHTATVDEPWATAFELPTTTSTLTVQPPGLDLNLTHSNNTATVEGTPTRAGFYTATIAYADQPGTTNKTITINVTCPTGHIQRTDRTCRAAGSMPADLVVPNDPPHGHKLYHVSQAALAGMVQAADEMNHKFRDDCAAIPEQYRLNRNLLVALLVSVQYLELIKHPSRPNSLMDLSRYDHRGTRNDNIHLYSLKTEAGDERAFWHPGVGLWQLDDINKYGGVLNHAQRAQATTGAKQAVMIIHDNYCNERTTIFRDPDDPGSKRTRDEIVGHIKDSLTEAAWVACGEPGRLIGKDQFGNDKYETCYSTFENIVKGDEFATDRSTRPHGPPLYLKVHDELTHEYGGVQPKTCRWEGGARSGEMFLCFKYDIERAEGYWHAHVDVDGNRIDSGGISRGGDRVSPLALPFLSFTYPESGTTGASKHVVFMKIDTPYGRDLIAAVPVGTDVRDDPPGSPSNGWWHPNRVDGSSVEIVEEW